MHPPPPSWRKQIQETQLASQGSSVVQDGLLEQKQIIFTVIKISTCLMFISVALYLEHNDKNYFTKLNVFHGGGMRTGMPDRVG